MHEASEGRPCVPENGQLGLDTRSVYEREATLIDVMNELKIVKEECRQLRTRMEGVEACQIEVFKTEEGIRRSPFQ